MLVDSINAPIAAVWVVLLRVAIGVIWLRSGVLKLPERDYLHYRERLERFISKNPFPWYRNFLEKVLLPYSLPAGYFFVTAEICLGVTLILGFLTVPMAILGAFFNLNFHLAAGWQNPSIPQLNYLMIMCHLIIVFSGAESHLALDALLFSMGG